MTNDYDSSDKHLGLELPPDDEHGLEVEELQRSSCVKSPSSSIVAVPGLSSVKKSLSSLSETIILIMLQRRESPGAK